MIELRVKSKEKLLAFFSNNQYRAEYNGYQQVINTNPFFHNTMFEFCGKVIKLTENPIGSTYAYTGEDREWRWMEEWLEPVNPIWLEQKK